MEGVWRGVGERDPAERAAVNPRREDEEITPPPRENYLRMQTHCRWQPRKRRRVEPLVMRRLYKSSSYSLTQNYASILLAR